MLTPYITTCGNLQLRIRAASAADAICKVMPWFGHTGLAISAKKAGAV